MFSFAFTPEAAPVVPRGFDPFGRWFEATFKHFVENVRVWLLQGLIYLLITLLLIGIPVAVIFMSSGLFPMFRDRLLHPGIITPPPSALPPDFFAHFIGAFVVIWVVSLLLSSYFAAGMIKTALKQVRGERTSVADLFSGGASTLPLIGANFLVGLALLASMIACCVPVLFVWPLFFLLMPMVVDRRQGVWESIMQGGRLVTQNYWLFFLYGLAMGGLVYAATIVVQVVLSIIPFAGLLANFVSIATMPIMMLMAVVPYVEIFYGQYQPTMTPQGWAQSPPAYLPPPYIPTPPTAAEAPMAGETPIVVEPPVAEESPTGEETPPADEA